MGVYTREIVQVYQTRSTSWLFVNTAVYIVLHVEGTVARRNMRVGSGRSSCGFPNDRGFSGMLQYGCVTAVLQISGWQFVHLNFACSKDPKIGSVRLEKREVQMWKIGLADRRKCG